LEIVLFTIGTIVIFFVIINYLRKLHLDAIHDNFLELADSIGGQVMRRGILSRPVYHGAFKSIELTINFSSERAQKKRRQYLDISMAKNSKYNITISTQDWIADRNEESSSAFESLKIPGDVNYVILKPANVTYVKKNSEIKFIECVKDLTPFTYIYIGQNGILFERECNNIAQCTKPPKLKDKIELLFELSKTLQ
jgi:hypothetical protein